VPPEPAEYASFLLDKVKGMDLELAFDQVRSIGQQNSNECLFTDYRVEDYYVKCNHAGRKASRRSCGVGGDERILSYHD